MKKVIKEYQFLLGNLPSVTVTVFVLSVVLMNLMANKVIFQLGNYAAGDGGLLLSWIPFLCMDTVTKRFGVKASIMLNIFGGIINVFCVLLFGLIALIPGNGQDYSAFNQIFGCVWFILLGSTIAYVISGIINSVLNKAVGNFFKDKPDSKKAYFCRAYVSTIIGQWVDNFLFSLIVFHIFAPIYWGWGFTFGLCIMTGFGGALLELIMEVMFSPIGYKIITRWDEEGVGIDWVNKYKEKI